MTRAGPPGPPDPADLRRLAALEAYAILDTPPEPGFDDIVQLATQICAVPIALVSLVDRDRQWFKARVGFDPGETPLSQSICVHALLQPGLLVIPDLRADVRTRTNTLVTGAPHLRFYAGTRLETAEGVALGTLCVIDVAPRPLGLTAAQASALQSLGRQVMTLLDLRRTLLQREEALAERRAAEAAMRTAQQQQRLATEAAGIGLWDYDPSTQVLRHDDLCATIFGHKPGAGVPWADMAAAIHPEDRDRVAAALERALDPSGTGEFSGQYRVVGPEDGRERWVESSGQVTVANGRVVRLIGVAQDITRRKDNERRQAALIDLGDALRDLDEVAEIEQAAARILGQALNVSRAGYGSVDNVQHTVEILQDWTAPGVASVAGLHRIELYGTLVAELEAGRLVAIDDARALPPVTADVEAIVGIGARAMLNVPILEHGKLVAMFFLHHRCGRTWSAEDISFVRNAADRVRAAIARLRAEAEQRLVNRELGHRLKNTLAMVQAIASQTMRNAATLETAREALAARLVALGQAHDILLRGGDDQAALRTLIQGSLALGGDLQAERFRIAGPDLVIGPKAALSVSLMIHELATNAAKYGALSGAEGRVEITWRIDIVEGRELFHMSWSEHDGPPVGPPSRRGFGSRLIERGLAGAVGGIMALAYEPTGVRCTLDAPLHAMLAGP